MQKIMESEYPNKDSSAERRNYEINMLLLFRLIKSKQFHKQIPGPMNEKTVDAYHRLVVFVNSMPEKEEKYQKCRQLFARGKEHVTKEKQRYLTDLAIYWKSLPDNNEMMEYKDIWEYVAQRPLAWELLPKWCPCQAKQDPRAIVLPQQHKDDIFASIKALSRRLCRKLSAIPRSDETADFKKDVATQTASSDHHSWDAELAQLQALLIKRSLAHSRSS